MSGHDLDGDSRMDPIYDVQLSDANFVWSKMNSDGSISLGNILHMGTREFDSGFERPARNSCTRQ